MNDVRRFEVDFDAGATVYVNIPVHGDYDSNPTERDKTHREAFRLALEGYPRLLAWPGGLAPVNPSGKVRASVTVQEVPHER
jgi:hypothetical protein